MFTYRRSTPPQSEADEQFAATLRRQIEIALRAQRDTIEDMLRKLVAGGFGPAHIAIHTAPCQCQTILVAGFPLGFFVGQHGGTWTDRCEHSDEAQLSPMPAHVMLPVSGAIIH